MNRLIIFVTLLIAFYNISAQEKRLTAIPENCYDIIIPDTASYVIFATSSTSILSKKQKLEIHSMDTGEFLWSMQFDPISGRVYALKDGILINNGNFKTEYLDYKTGKPLHKYKIYPAFFDEDKDLLVGYKGKFNKLAGYGISSEKEFWKTKTENNDERTLSPISNPDSNIVIFQGSNLLHVNIATGETCEYCLSSRVSDKKSNAANIGIGLATAFLGGGVLFIPTYFSNLGSKAITDSIGNIYVADHNALMCLNSELHEIWRYELPKSTGSKSYLSLNGDTLHMLNTGTADTAGRTRKFGKPFIASFDKNTGAQINSHMFPEKYDKTIFGDYICFFIARAYTYDQNQFRLKPLDFGENEIRIVSADGNLLHVDRNLNILDEIPNDSIFFIEGFLPSGMILMRRDEEGYPVFVAIDKENTITDIWDDVSDWVAIRGNRIYMVKDGYLIMSTK